MYKRKRNIFALCLSAVMLITTVAFTDVTLASTKLGGSDRYETALKIVQAGWTTSNSAVIARGDDLADALAAAPLAYAKGKAPILLTTPSKLPAGVLEQLKLLGVKDVYIVGGTGAVSTEVENSLKEFNVKRLTGQDRAETSYNVANEAFPVAPKEVVIANGLAYADALSISSVAAVKGMPILLVTNNKLSANEESYIAGKTVYAVGGTGVLSSELVDNKAKAERIAGIDRYETNAAILNKFPQDFSKMYIAKGTKANLVDALTGSALAALGNNPIILVDDNSVVKASIKTIIKSKITANSTEFLLGSTVNSSAAVSVEALKPQPLEVVSIE